MKSFSYHESILSYFTIPPLLFQKFLYHYEYVFYTGTSEFSNTRFTFIRNRLFYLVAVFLFSFWPFCFCIVASSGIRLRTLLPGKLLAVPSSHLIGDVLMLMKPSMAISKLVKVLEIRGKASWGFPSKCVAVISCSRQEQSAPIIG